MYKYITIRTTSPPLFFFNLCHFTVCVRMKKLDPSVQLARGVTCNGRRPIEFVPQRISAYICQQNVHMVFKYPKGKGVVDLLKEGTCWEAFRSIWRYKKGSSQSLAETGLLSGSFVIPTFPALDGFILSKEHVTMVSTCLASSGCLAWLSRC